MPLEAGRLRDRVTILTRSATRSALGQAETWSVTDTRWGVFRVVSNNARALFLQALNTEATHEAIFRDVPGVVLTIKDHRLKWRNVEYEIVSPPSDLDGTHKFTRILCKAVA